MTNRPEIVFNLIPLYEFRSSLSPEQPLAGIAKDQLLRADTLELPGRGEDLMVAHKGICPI